MILNDSLNKLPSFNWEGSTLWKENMRIIIEKLNFDIWKSIKNDYFVLTHQVNYVMVNKEEDEWTKDKGKKFKSVWKRRLGLLPLLVLMSFLCF